MLLERLDPGAAAILAASVGALSGAVLWNKRSWSTEPDHYAQISLPTLTPTTDLLKGPLFSLLLTTQ